MRSFIGKSGTGIGKSGTGIGKSGTGIGKSGTGQRFKTVIGVVAFAAVAFVADPVLADDSGLLVTQQQDRLMVSVHGDDGIVAGFTPLSEGVEGYYSIVLQQVFRATDDEIVMRPLVKGSGSGASDESCASDNRLMVKGSGSGASDERCDASGSSLMVKGSGSGASGEVCVIGGHVLVKGSGSGASDESNAPGGGLLVKGSGSGASGESYGSGGGQVLVKGSGSGNSDESVSACEAMGVWGVAEVVVDQAGMHVMVHRLNHSGLDEFLVAQIDPADHDRSNPTENVFIATP